MSDAVASLDMRTALPLMRAAFESRQMQCFTSPLNPPIRVSCMYKGPCVIGSALPESDRVELDEQEGTDVLALYDNGALEIPSEQVADFEALQEAHDSAVGARSQEEREEFILGLGEILASAEERYGG